MRAVVLCVCVAVGLLLLALTPFAPASAQSPVGLTPTGRSAGDIGSVFGGGIHPASPGEPSDPDALAELQRDIQAIDGAFDQASDAIATHAANVEAAIVEGAGG